MAECKIVDSRVKMTQFAPLPRSKRTLFISKENPKGEPKLAIEED